MNRNESGAARALRRLTKVLVTVVLTVVVAGASVQARGIELPGTIVGTAYPTGTTTYSQMVGIGSVLQREHGVNLRVIPGRNDVSRLEPLRRGRADFAAAGAEAGSAQEGIHDFGGRGWGPQPVRSGLWNMSDSCSFSLYVHGDSEIESVQDLQDKRVPYVHGASAPNAGVEYLMRYGELTWNDVQVVEMGGFNSMMEAFLDDRIDVLWTSCDSQVLHRLTNAPRGIDVIEFPHEDAEAIERVTDQVPWFYPHVSTENIGLDADEIEVFSSPNTLVVTYASIDAELVYNITKAMHVHFDDYQDAAPGQEGWAMDRQELETSFLPFHEGAVEYFKEVGLWTETAEANQEMQLRRQDVLKAAWEDYIDNAPSDDDQFAKGWMKARHDALTENNLDPLMETW